MHLILEILWYILFDFNPDDKYQEKSDESSQRSKRSPLREPNCQWEPAERDYSNLPHDAPASHKPADSALDTTDPKAIRDTERHFINDISGADEYQAYKYTSQRESAGRKLAHVGVKVPSSRSRGTASALFEPAKTHPHATTSIKEPEHMSKTQRGDAHLAASSNSTFTVNSSHRRLKKSLKDVNKNGGEWQSKMIVTLFKCLIKPYTTGSFFFLKLISIS